MLIPRAFLTNDLRTKLFFSPYFRETNLWHVYWVKDWIRSNSIFLPNGTGRLLVFSKILDVVQSLSHVQPLRPHGLQHTRLPCPSVSPRVCSNSHPLVSDAAQPSHPLLPTSPPSVNAEAEDPVCWQSDAKIHRKGEKWQFEKYLLNVGLTHVEVKIYSIHVVQEALYFIKHIKKILYRLIGKHKCNKEIELQECKIVWRRQWHPTPVLLPGKSHGQRSLGGCSPWGR